jgi:hypothetical protein
MAMAERRLVAAKRVALSVLSQWELFTQIPDLFICVSARLVVDAQVRHPPFIMLSMPHRTAADIICHRSPRRMNEL